MSIILRLPSPPEGSKPSYPLDNPSLLDQLNFFKSKTGIEDDEKLKLHICRIQEKIYELFPFPCVWNFDFVRGKIVNHPMYQEVIQSAKNQSVAQKIFVDFGANVGSDLRQVVLDGWKREDVLAIDIIPSWIELGNELFKSVDQPIPYFIGDIFKPEVFDPTKPPSAQCDSLDLFSLKDLNALKGRATIISANFMFHLFGEADQERLAEYFALLLSNQPGSTIFGQHRGSENAGIQKLPYAAEAHWYSHSVEVRSVLHFIFSTFAEKTRC
ncbi:hypothetical protein PGTUg99_034636 [Puccinia graminis f. sp. tritici]|uniref:Methyltransferase type 11 domain-containing protein n=1 Tax=Puccinia graminis f. sp. tritici TaxID=56615 RepID=A0A5B0NLC5_PUCGR|nr:hypothetical protein PGTUg99_034636 [Puccinia graminis f. sp. tritici]